MSRDPRICPQCGDDDTRPDGCRRNDVGCLTTRRLCLHCGFRWGMCRDPYCGNHTGPAPERYGAAIG